MSVRMKMHNDQVPDVAKATENGEPANASTRPSGAQNLTISQKYRELKGRLKYLIYVRVQSTLVRVSFIFSPLY